MHNLLDSKMDEIRMDTFLDKSVHQLYEEYAIIKSGLYDNIQNLKKMVEEKGE